MGEIEYELIKTSQTAQGLKTVGAVPAVNWDFGESAFPITSFDISIILCWLLFKVGLYKGSFVNIQTE